MDAAALKLWLQKWRWYERNSLPWNRARIHWEFMRRGAFVRWPVHGNVLEALLEGRLEIGEQTLFEPGVWITAPGQARVRIGAGTFLNLGVMVASLELVEIGDHCMFANGCYITDSSHRFDDPDRPVTWQGFTSKGPTRIWRQRLVWHKRRRHEWRHRRSKVRHRGEQRCDERHPAVFGGRRGAGAGLANDHVLAGLLPLGRPGASGASARSQC